MWFQTWHEYRHKKERPRFLFLEVSCALHLTWNMFVLKDSVTFLAQVMKPFRVVASLNIIRCSGIAYSCMGRKLSKVSVSM